MEINKKSKNQEETICKELLLHMMTQMNQKEKIYKELLLQEETIYKELFLQTMRQMKQKEDLIPALTQLLEQQKENNRILKKITDKMSLIVNNTNDDN
tara:strand:+ start:1131 stop:1424 length:294 start_codon:yes stop_codon:yes gene_type:complete